MKNHGFSIASALIGIVLALIGLNSEKAFAQIPEDVLKSIPRACQYIVVIDVQRLVASNLYVRSLQEPQLIGKMKDNLVDFAKITGAVPERDISSLLVAGSRQSDLYGEFIIAAGRFDKNEIKRRVLSGTHSAEQHYRGAEILPAEVQNGIILKAAVFFSDQEIALGSLRFLQEVLDAKAAAKKNILSDPWMASLIRALPSGEMFWFAGKSAAVLDLAPVPIPIMSSYRNIQDISGTFNVTDTVTGKVTLTAINPNAAATLENYYKRMAAVSRLLEDQNAGLKLLAEGLTIDTNQTQVSLSMDFKGDALAKIWNWGFSSFDISEIRNRAVGISKPSVIGKGGDLPVALFNPLPSYTESARKKRIEGIILVEVIILKDGTTGGFKVLRGLGYGLDESAVYTIANRWRFIPGVVDGKVVDTAVQIEVSFRLY